MNFPHNATSLIVPIELRDNLGNLRTGVLFSDSSLTVEYAKPGDSSFTTVTTVTAAAGTYTASGWIEFASSGMYQLGLPDAAVNANSYVTIRVTYGDDSPVFHQLFFTGALDASTTRAPANLTAIEGVTTPYTGISLIQWARGIISMAVGNLTGNGTTLRDPNDETDVAQFTTGSGNRTRTGINLDDPSP